MKDYAMAVNSNIDEPSVELLLSSNSETDPHGTSHDGSTTENTGASSGEEGVWCNSGEVTGGSRSIYFTSKWEQKKGHVVSHGRSFPILPGFNQSSMIATYSELGNDTLDTKRLTLK